MKAVVLAGGLGTRLRPLTFAVPKPLIPVGERPILEILIENLARHGVRDVYLAVGYRAELIRLYFQDGRRLGVNLHYSQEERRLGTAGPLRLIRDTFRIGEPVLAMNSDIITQLDLRDFYDRHLERPAVITVGIRTHEHVVPYGVVDVEGERIRSIEERPRHAFRISCGIYVVDPEVVDLVPADRHFDMPDLIRAAIANGHGVCAHEIREPWVAIESLQDLAEETERNEMGRDERA